MAKNETDKYASKSDLERLNNFMALVVLVLMIGFILGLITLAIDAIGSLKSDTESRDILIQEVQHLNDKIK